MHKWTRFGLLFFAAVSVYYGQATVADQGSPTGFSGGAGVKVLGADPTTQPIAVAAPRTPPTPTPVTLADDGSFNEIHIVKGTDLIDELLLLGRNAQVTIIPSKGVTGTLPAMDLYHVTLHDALDAILQTNDLAWQQKGNFIYIYTREQWNAIQKATHVPRTEVFHLNYTSAADVDKLIKTLLSADGKDTYTVAAVSGIDTGSNDTASSGTGSTGGSTGSTGGNSYAGDEMLIVTDYPENLAAIAQVIREVDHRPRQVLIEATILEATLTENNALGIDFSFMGGVDLSSLLSNGTTVSGALSGSILNTASSSTNNTAAIVQKGYSGFTTGNYDTQVPPGGLQIGIVKDGLGVFLQALETITDTTVLANPKVLALDKQTGEVIVGRQDGYQTTTVTQTTSTQTVQFIDTGTILSFRPFVGDDGYIRMEIHPEDSTGGLTTSNLPFKVTTEVTSNVMIKDGNTIVIGGLFRESSSTSRSQVPFLGSIPFAGALFRSQADATTRQEIIILLTPHIIKDDAEYSRASEEVLKDAEKLRVGMRQGMMWTGRERLATCCYESALAELNKPIPDVNKAIWHLDCAININPHFLEAILLKERLTGKQVTDVDNSMIRGFVRQQIMEDRMPPPPPASPADLPPPGPAMVVPSTQRSPTAAGK